MIKVKDTKTHREYKILHNGKSFIDKHIETLVTDAELVLVECKPKEAKLLIHNTTLHLYDYKEEHKEFLWLEESKYYKPILISRTEKMVQKGNSFYNSKSKTIFVQDMWDEMEVIPEETESKILALPEHFSSQQLQDIVDGKLKEGKCLVECEVDGKIINKTFPANVKDRYFVKLNPHITIYPVEKKMYTREELELAELKSKFLTILMLESACGKMKILVGSEWIEVDEYRQILSDKLGLNKM